MERLFTSITNAGQTATQNEKFMQTGYYAGEREDINSTIKMYKQYKIKMYN